MIKPTFLILSLACAAATPASSASFEEQAVDAGRQAASLSEGLRARLAAERAASFIRIEDATTMTLTDVCKRKVGVWPFKFDRPVTCYGISFTGYFIDPSGGAERRIERTWIVPFESLPEAEALLADLKRAGRPAAEEVRHRDEEGKPRLGTVEVAAKFIPKAEGMKGPADFLVTELTVTIKTPGVTQTLSYTFTFND